MDIRPLEQGDAGAAMALYAATVAAMRADGHFQWNDTYPNRETLERDIAAGTAFGAWLVGELAGLISVDSNQSPEYEPIPFAFGEPIRVVHRLAIHPAYQRQGLSSALMDFAEERARAAGCRAMRLDTCEDNGPALALYQNRGYVVRGTCHFLPRPFTFIVMEKQLY